MLEGKGDLALQSNDQVYITNVAEMRYIAYRAADALRTPARRVNDHPDTAGKAATPEAAIASAVAGTGSNANAVETAAAGMLAATIHFFNAYPVEAWWVSIPWLVLVGLTGFLMVSTWRFWSGKEINLTRRHPFQLLLLLAVIIYIALRFSQGVIFAGALAYMFSGIWARAAYGWSRRRRRPEPAVAPDPAPDPAPKPEPEPLGPRFTD